MWLFGKASQKEIETIKKQGWKTEEVEETYFNKCLDPKYNPKEDSDLNEHDEDKMVAVFVDNDIAKQLTAWHNEELAHDRMAQQQQLEKARREKVQNLYETKLEMPEDMPILETEGICIDGNHYIQEFYYEPLIAGEDCIKGTFHVKFEEGTDKVVEYYPGDGVPIPVD